MRGGTRALLIFVLPLVIGKLLEMVLSSRPGRAVAEKAGQAVLTTEDGIDLAKKYAAAGAGAFGALATAVAGNVNPPVTALPNPRTMTRAAIAEDTAELLLATGAAVKIIGSFMRDREKLKAKTLGGYLPRVEFHR